MDQTSAAWSVCTSVPYTPHLLRPASRGNKARVASRGPYDAGRSPSKLPPLHQEMFPWGAHARTAEETQRVADNIKLVGVAEYVPRPSNRIGLRAGGGRHHVNRVIATAGEQAKCRATQGYLVPLSWD
jgi:hypothetical protein